MPANTATLTNVELLSELRRLLRDLERRVANYRLADEDPETENIAADEGLLLCSRSERLLQDTYYTLGNHRRHFVQMRPSDEDDDDDGA